MNNSTSSFPLWEMTIITIMLSDLGFPNPHYFRYESEKDWNMKIGEQDNYISLTKMGKNYTLSCMGQIIPPKKEKPEHFISHKYPFAFMSKDVKLVFKEYADFIGKEEEFLAKQL